MKYKFHSPKKTSNLYKLVLQSMDHFDDIGPSVVMASPGMMQSGLSRELFESWCTDKRNGVIIAGYCVEGTLAKVNLLYLQRQCHHRSASEVSWT